MKHLFTTLAAALLLAFTAQADDAGASAQDSQHVVSPDGKWNVFVRTLPGKEISTGIGGSAATELWQTSADGKNATVLVRAKESDEGSSNLAAFSDLQFSTDGRYVFFLSDAFATTRALHVVDTTNGKEHFICAAGSFQVIRSGEYRDCLLVGQRRYFIAGGVYFGLWIFRPDGKEIGPVIYYADGEPPAASEYDDAGLADALKKFEDLSKAEEITPAAATPAATPEYKNER